MHLPLVVAKARLPRTHRQVDVKVIDEGAGFVLCWYGRTQRDRFGAWPHLLGSMPVVPKAQHLAWRGEGDCRSASKSGGNQEALTLST